MKKVTLFFAALFVAVSFSFAGNSYKVNDASVNALFSQATEVQFVSSVAIADVNMPVQVLEAKNRMTAGLLGIFLGGCGVHRWYLGSSAKVWGVYIILSVCTSLGGIIGLIDGIMILTETDDEFNKKWVGSEKIFNW